MNPDDHPPPPPVAIDTIRANGTREGQAGVWVGLLVVAGSFIWNYNCIIRIVLASRPSPPAHPGRHEGMKGVKYALLGIAGVVVDGELINIGADNQIYREQNC